MRLQEMLVCSYFIKQRWQSKLWFRQGPSDVRILNHLFLLIYILGAGTEAAFAFCAWCFLEDAMLKENGVIWYDNCKQGLHREPKSTTQLPLFRFPCGKNASIYNLIKMPPRTNNALPIFFCLFEEFPKWEETLQLDSGAYMMTNLVVDFCLFLLSRLLLSLTPLWPKSMADFFWILTGYCQIKRYGWPLAKQPRFSRVSDVI